MTKKTQKGRDFKLTTGKVLKQFPTKRYDVVYLDPPWQYDDRLNNGNRGAEHKYETMTLAELREMPIPDILKKDSCVFMWITPPLIFDGMRLAESWGLEYVTRGFLWMKLNKVSVDTFLGLGRWTRGNPEDCFVFRPKGSKFKPQEVPDEVIRGRIREHSRKPDTARARIDEICGDVYKDRIELFSRHTFEGWDCWGNETGKFNKLPTTTE